MNTCIKWENRQRRHCSSNDVRSGCLFSIYHCTMITVVTCRPSNANRSPMKITSENGNRNGGANQSVNQIKGWIDNLCDFMCPIESLLLHIWFCFAKLQKWRTKNAEIPNHSLHVSVPLRGKPAQPMNLIKFISVEGFQFECQKGSQCIVSVK